MAGVRPDGGQPRVRTVIELAEYESVEIELSSADANLLHSNFGDRLTVTPAGAGRWQITARQFVGTIRSGDLVIHIRPKVKLANLLALMDVEVPSEIWHDEVVSLERDPNLLSVMARLFCVAMEDVSRRGIRRSYVTRAERLVAPRGRLDLAQILRQPGLVSPVPCRYDEHTADTPINQVLKAAVESARRLSGVSPTWQRRLLRQASELDEVSESARSFDWVERWKPSPMELHYETAVRLAAMLLGGTSLSSRSGTVGANSFLLNMNSLFERWVGRRLGEMLPVEVKEQWSTSLGRGGEVGMNPDLTFWSTDRAIAVADCKYKLVRDGIGRSHDYYQALAYATAMALPECWLLYARLPGESPVRDVVVRNADIAVRTFAVDLTGSIDDAVSQLRSFGDALLDANCGARQ